MHSTIAYSSQNVVIYTYCIVNGLVKNKKDITIVTALRKVVTIKIEKRYC